MRFALHRVPTQALNIESPHMLVMYKDYIRRVNVQKYLQLTLLHFLTPYVYHDHMYLNFESAQKSHATDFKDRVHVFKLTQGSFDEPGARAFLCCLRDTLTGLMDITHLYLSCVCDRASFSAVCAPHQNLDI